MWIVDAEMWAKENYILSDKENFGTFLLYIGIPCSNTIRVIMSLKSNGESDEITAQQTIQGWFKDIGSQLGRIPEDLSVLNGLVGATLTDGTVNDRK